MKSLKRLSLSKTIRGKVYLTPVYEDDSTASPLPFASPEAALEYAARQYPQLPVGHQGRVTSAQRARNARADDGEGKPGP